MSKDLTQTHNFPLNRSISKQLYSFPKANRFETTRGPLCNRAFYDIKKGAFGNRTTTFGFGNKMDLVNREPVPPVGNYRIKDQFTSNQIKNRGYSFSKDNKDNSFENPERSMVLPGPGAYDHNRKKSIDKYATLSYTMGNRIEDPLRKHQNNLGPGQYDTIPSLTKSGHYFYSKYGNSGCRIMGKAQRQSINDPSITPGPGKCTFILIKIKVSKKLASIKPAFTSTPSLGIWRQVNSANRKGHPWLTPSLCPARAHSKLLQ